MLSVLSMGITMHSLAQRHPRILGMLLTLLLVFFSVPCLAAAIQNSPANPEILQEITQLPSQDVLIPQDGGHQTPITSLTSLTIFRHGSWLPEKLANAEPEYELVIELASTATLLHYHHGNKTLSPGNDWTRSPPVTRHRIAGWKDSNLQYRFISQAQA